MSYKKLTDQQRKQILREIQHKRWLTTKEFAVLVNRHPKSVLRNPPIKPNRRNGFPYFDRLEWEGLNENA